MMSDGPDDEQSVSAPLAAAVLFAALAIGFQSVDRASSVALAGQDPASVPAFRAAELLAAVVGWLGLS